MPVHAALQATTRVALVAYLHDLGKLAERAGAFKGDPRLDANLQLYCPFHQDGGWFSHRHAANTALAMDTLEPHLPRLLGLDPYPFTGRRRAGDAEGADGVDATDSMLNAAAAHHKPDTFLQWIVATADRVASGFEREEFDSYNAGQDKTRSGRNHYQARQLTLFEQLKLEGHEPDESALKWRYPLTLLAPTTIFPALAKDCEPQKDDPARAEYALIWNFLLEEIKRIPGSHRESMALWLDHFDSLWLTCTHAIPAATAFNVRPEVSLYDHSHTAAALAAALWRWHESQGRTDADAAALLKSRSDFQTQKFLLVQGDFFGIQDFIFATGGKTRKQAAKLLRGRSFQVSLFTEIAALRVLDGLGLPPTSQVINAAGKFLIVAPNTPEVLAELGRIRSELDAWFEKHAFGMAGVGLAWEPASCNDFLRRHGERNEDTPFSQLLVRLHDNLDTAKHQRFDLAGRGARVFDVDFPHGPCAWNGRLPADQVDKADKGMASCALSRDQIGIGEAIVKGLDRLLVLTDDTRPALSSASGLQVLELPLFGYAVAFTRNEDATGRFGALAASDVLRRCWDFSAPSADDAGATRPLFAGYSRRFISGYVPRVAPSDLPLRDRYGAADGEMPDEIGDLKTLDMLACEDRQLDANGKWRGVAALGVLKGDIDDLGELFRVGLRQPSFAKWAALSRQVNGFFAIYLPWLLGREFPSVYTVFAGGDDFFLIGPWRSVQQLSARLSQEFSRYAAGNSGIHFSAGIATQKPGAPVQSLAALAELALDAAKLHPGKNAITCFAQTVPWSDWPALESATSRLDQLRQQLGLSTAFVYGLLQFVEMQQREAQGDAASAIWRSRLAYRTRRMLLKEMRGVDDVARQRMQVSVMQEIGAEGIARHSSAYRIVLFNHLYQFRDR
jgi:CRISPR-associated protein Csm1